MVVTVGMERRAEEVFKVGCAGSRPLMCSANGHMGAMQAPSATTSEPLEAVQKRLPVKRESSL